jgi:SAM-dependent methyltransferase
MLRIFLKSIFSGRSLQDAENAPEASRPLPGKSVLNVGGGNKKIPIPPQYDGWNHVLLDIDPRSAPDVVCDARRLTTLPSAVYDSVYCSHNLEHYYQHDVKKVLAGFLHVLKKDGFVLIRVPDIGYVMRTVVERGLDIDDFLYQSPAGPITVKDVIYGYGVEIEQSGVDFYAHKTGFTEKSLTVILEEAGFPFICSWLGNLEITAFAFKTKPSDDLIAQFGLTSPSSIHTATLA